MQSAVAYSKAMNLPEFDAHFQELLDMPGTAKIDSSTNGVQISCSDKKILKVATAVDACAESAARAAAWGADLLFVHHGVFWGRVVPVTGVHYNRVKSFLDNDMALYAAHLPLDQHPVYGNNAQIAGRLELGQIEPFGEYKGAMIGFQGRLDEPMSLKEIALRLFGTSDDLLGLLPFGPESVQTVGVISGGAPWDVVQAIDLGLDLFITGDAAHSVYHNCLEAGINVMFGGHYRTETFGVEAIADYCSSTLGLESTFIDIPTGL